MRITPENIKQLIDNQVFVFGSNLRGVHGAGAAKQAMKWGAKYGQGYGLQGQTFAIPTKDWDIKSLSLNQIQVYVDRFIKFAKTYDTLDFLVTKIGCGLAGYEIEDIAPMFKECVNLKNVYLPIDFINVIINE